MKKQDRYLHYVLTLFVILISGIAKADIWVPPTIKRYYSENKEYKLVVTPTIIPKKYYLWNYYNSNNHPQTKRVLKNKEKFLQNITGNDTVIIPCKAELYHIFNNNDSVLIWKRNLLNDICPVFAIISNDGSSVATFDNWYSTGYGVNVFVVYNKIGDAIKTYKLDEISPFPLNDFSRSISSIDWRNEVRFSDNDRIEIIFIDENMQQIKKIYNLKRLGFDE